MVFHFIFSQRMCVEYRSRSTDTSLLNDRSRCCRQAKYCTAAILNYSRPAAPRNWHINCFLRATGHASVLRAIPKPTNFCCCYVPTSSPASHLTTHLSSRMLNTSTYWSVYVRSMSLGPFFVAVLMLSANVYYPYDRGLYVWKTIGKSILPGVFMVASSVYSNSASVSATEQDFGDNAQLPRPRRSRKDAMNITMTNDQVSEARF